MSKPIYLILPLFFSLACSHGGDNDTGGQGAENVNLATQVYVVSEESDELFVLDVEPNPPVAVGSVDTNLVAGESNANHMAMVSEDGKKVYVTATHRDAVVVVSRLKMEVVGTIPVGLHPTHATMREGFGELWVVNEDSGSVSVIDTEADAVIQTITHPSMIVPHFVRWDVTNTYAYVPSIGGNQVTIIDALSYSVIDTIVADGLSEGACSGDPCGFADAQIDPNGLLYAAHIETGSVVVYDTRTMSRVADLAVGPQPWIAYVEQFDGPTTFHYLVPNFGDSTLSRIDAEDLEVEDHLPEGDTETYGVNYSPLAPGLAFVMNRNREEITVVDVEIGVVVDRIDTGGTVETACTTDDGRYIIAPLSSTGEVSVIDVTTLSEVARFQNVGTYPWSAATLGGQNYCH